jgi:hypothetical protein
MSPAAAKPGTIKAAGATDGRSEVTVDIHGGRVIVDWLGASCRRRSFTPEDLRDAVRYVEMLAEHSDGQEVWVHQTDSDGAEFYARLHDGRFYADDRAHDEAPNVPWSTFKRALIARSK